MEEKFNFSFNGVRRENPMTMEEAIDIARNRAIAGKTTVLSVGAVELGTYSKDPNSPRIYTDPITREESPVECCKVKYVMPQKRS